MLTRCYSCESCFEINDRLVMDDDATVCCGECGITFDARQHLVDEYSGAHYQLPEDIWQPDPAPAIADQPPLAGGNHWSPDTPPHPHAYAPDAAIPLTGAPASTEESDPRQRADKHDPGRTMEPGQLAGIDSLYPDSLPPQSRLSQAAPVAASAGANAAQSLPRIHLSDYPAIADDLLERKGAISQPLAAKAATEPLPATDPSLLDEPEKAGKVSWTLPIVLLVTGLVVSAYSFRDSLAQLPAPRPVLEAFCSLTGCQLPVQRNVAALNILNKTTYSHPAVDGALVITVDLVNRAQFSQPYPTLSVIMADEAGRTVAERKFPPRDYLAEEFTEAQLEVNKPVRIDLEVMDPGREAKSFEIELL